MIRPILLAACALAFSAAHADEPSDFTRLRDTCPAGAFPSTLKEIAALPRLPRPSDIERRHGTDDRWPPEIHDMKRGMSLSIVGASINDGWSMWRAIDFDRRIAIDIQSNSGRKLEVTPEMLTDEQRPGTIKRIRHRPDLGPEVDVIRIAPMSDTELLNAACIANRMVAIDEVAQRLQIFSIPRRPNLDILESNIELVVAPGRVGYQLGDANDVEHGQLRALLAAKFAQ